MDILNFISWIKGRRQVTSVDTAKTLLPVGIKDPKRDDDYIAGAISVQDFINQVGAGEQGPQGPIGPQGVPGPVGPAGLTWQGLWSAAGTYAENDAVSFGGASYFCYNPGGVGPSLSNPTVDTANWALLASQGAVGPQGPQGIQGPAGVSLPYFYLSGVTTITSTSETIFNSILIPANTYTGVEAIGLTAQLIKTQGYTADAKVYINTVNNLAGATQIAYVTNGSTIRYSGLVRTFYLDGTNMYIFPELSTSNSDNVVSTSSGQTVTVDWTVNQYIIFTGSVSSAGQVFRLRGAKIY